MKKEERGLSLKKALFLFAIILILIIVASYVKKDYCDPTKYTITDTSSKLVTRNLEDWFNFFGGEFKCLDSEADANLVSGKTNYIVCGIKPQETGEYSIEITKINTLINKPPKIESWFAEKKWAGTAVENEITKTSIELNIPEGMEGEALSLEVVLRKDTQLIATETSHFKVIEKDSSREMIC